MTSPGTLSQDVLDAMREWLLDRPDWTPAAKGAVRAAPRHIVTGMVARYYPGGVSAFIRVHEGRGGDA